jgi:hypothetical protein
MNDAIRIFLADEERALEILVNTAVGVMGLGLAVAIGVIVLMS